MNFSLLAAPSRPKELPPLHSIRIVLGAIEDVDGPESRFATATWQRWARFEMS